MNDAKYWLFATVDYEARGGADDLISVCDTMNTAWRVMSDNDYGYDNWELVEVRDNIPFTCYYAIEGGWKEYEHMQDWRYGWFKERRIDEGKTNE